MSPIKHESGAEMWLRLNRQPPKQSTEFNFFPDSTLCPSRLYEICGRSGSGKSAILYAVLCKFLTSRENNGYGLGVIFIDNDFKFDIWRLCAFLEKECPNEQSTETHVREALSHLQYFSCDGSDEFLETLSDIEASLSINSKLNPDKRNNSESFEHPIDKRPCLLVIDGIAAFYHLDRCDDKTGVEDYTNLNRIHKIYAQRLKHLASDYDLTIMTTQLTIKITIEDSKDGSNQQHKTIFPMQWPWREAVDCCISLDKRGRIYESSRLKFTSGKTCTDFLCNFIIKEDRIVFQ